MERAGHNSGGHNDWRDVVFICLCVDIFAYALLILYGKKNMFEIFWNVKFRTEICSVRVFLGIVTLIFPNLLLKHKKNIFFNLYDFFHTFVRSLVMISKGKECLKLF